MRVYMDEGCRCAECIAGTVNFRYRVNRDCDFLIEDEEGTYRCVLADPRTQEEKELAEKYREFLKEKRRIHVGEDNILIMKDDKDCLEEFRKYLQKTKHNE